MSMLKAEAIYKRYKKQSFYNEVFLYWLFFIVGIVVAILLPPSADKYTGYEYLFVMYCIFTMVFTVISINYFIVNWIFKYYSKSGAIGGMISYGSNEWLWLEVGCFSNVRYVHPYVFNSFSVKYILSKYLTVSGFQKEGSELMTALENENVDLFNQLRKESSIEDEIKILIEVFLDIDKLNFSYSLLAFSPAVVNAGIAIALFFWGPLGPL
jgi:hypothetical protein